MSVGRLLWAAVKVQGTKNKKILIPVTHYSHFNSFIVYISGLKKSLPEIKLKINLVSLYIDKKTTNLQWLNLI